MFFVCFCKTLKDDERRITEETRAFLIKDEVNRDVLSLVEAHMGEPIRNFYQSMK